MSFDLSRVTFNSWNDFLGAVMLQGRPQLDSDWNDQQAEVLRRLQVGTLDALGQAVYPAALTNSFAIAASSSGGVNQILIGAGRMYVDGILAENHGPAAVSAQGDPVPTAAAQWDPSLAELSNTYAGAPFAAGAVAFNQQPYYPPGIPSRELTLPTTNGPFLVYLDVWQRAVTYIEDPNLVEKAVGVDTTGRWQTVWQVKVLDVSKVTPVVDCTTPLSSIPVWVNLTQSSAGRLSSNVVPSPPSGPCCLTPNTGYTGQENQLYRVEIHVAGPYKQATFKWSKENASVMTGVTGITTVTNSANVTASQLTVESLGRDEVLGFKVGDWIEILDDTQDLNNQSGFLHMIDSISVSARTITLDSTVDTTTVFPLTSGGLTIPSRHTRIRRWDQSGQVKDTNGNVVADVSVPGGSGDIPIPDGTTVIVLENGVTVQFNLNPANGVLLPGDYWNFAARAADGSVEVLNQAPPLGIHHHYARLSVVTFPGTAPDCRTPWPPAPASNPSCGCTIIIQPTDVSATNTLQQVLDQFKNLKTATVICLQPGIYNLYAPLQLTAAHSNITLQACQAGTAVLQPASQLGNALTSFNNGMIVLDTVSSFTLGGLAFSIPTVPFSATSFAGLPLGSLSADVSRGVQLLEVAIGVRPVNCASLTITECVFSVPAVQLNDGATLFGAAVFVSGTCSGLLVENNQFDGGGTFAGVLGAPAVAFAPAPTTVENVSSGKPVLEKAPGALESASESAAVKAAARVQFEATKAKVVVANPGIAEDIGVKLGPPLTSFQPVFNAENNLASYAVNGGSVLPCVLTDAVFKGNAFTNLTVAVILVGKASEIEFTDNEVDACAGGFWLLSASMAAMITLDPQQLATAGLVVALGYPLPVVDSQPVTVPAAPAAIRVYTGGKPLKDQAGDTWQPENSVKSLKATGDPLNALNQPKQPHAITGALPGQSDEPLYQNERWGVFKYTIAVPVNGYYQVTLKFAEITFGASGKRIFNVAINGQEVLSEFDIFADTGGEYVAADKVFSNIVPNKGYIVVSFTRGDGEVDWPKISAIQVEPQWDGAIPNSYLTGPDAAAFYGGEVQRFYGQLTQLAQQGFAALDVAALRLRLDDNEMTGLTSAACLILWDDQIQNGNVSSLMMAGNRLEATIALPDGVSLPATEACWYFLSVVSAAFVTQCVVPGNLLLNEGEKEIAVGRIEKRLSLVVDANGALVDYSPAKMKFLTRPLAQLSVAGNVLQGTPLVSPQPNSVFLEINSVTA
jgi:hypothetical protein